MTLELSRQRMREHALSQFKHIRTCVLARELCVLVRLNRVALNRKDVQGCCSLIANLCKEAGCEEPSEMCGKAAEAVMKDEETYLQLCEESCKKCGEQRKPRRAKPKEARETTHYVA